MMWNIFSISIFIFPCLWVVDPPPSGARPLNGLLLANLVVLSIIHFLLKIASKQLRKAGNEDRLMKMIMSSKTNWCSQMDVSTVYHTMETMVTLYGSYEFHKKDSCNVHKGPHGPYDVHATPGMPIRSLRRSYKVLQRPYKVHTTSK